MCEQRPSNRDIDYVDYNLSEQLKEQQEYETRVFYWKIDFSGSLHVPTNINFHPSLFIGSQSDYDKIYNNYLKGREDEFKITGEHKFDTLEDYNKKFKNITA